MSIKLGSSLGKENRMDSVPEKAISSECEGKIDALLQILSLGEIDILYNKLKGPKRTQIKMKGKDLGYRSQMGNLAMSHGPKL